jgi:hypothetical protein
MTWHIVGSQVTIGYRGWVPYVSGSASQFFRPATTAGGGDHVEGLPALWSIHPNSASELEIDPNGEGLAQRAHDQPEIAHFKITYFSATNGDDAAIGFTSCLPERLFEKTFTLWQGVVFGNRGVTYSIILDFLGFRLEQAKTEKPTLNEWLMGSKPAFGNEIEISFRSQGS